MPLRISLQHAGHCPVAVLSVNGLVPVTGFYVQEIGAVFLCLPLYLPEKAGSDPLPPVRLVHPQVVDLRTVLAVDAPCDPGDDPTAFVRDLFVDGDVCVLAGVSAPLSFPLPGVHVHANQPLAGADEDVRADEAAEFRTVITGVQIVQSRLGVVVVPDGGFLRGGRERLPPRNASDCLVWTGCFAVFLKTSTSLFSH